MPPSDKPNILVIWGDDIGITNLSCYSDGLMGYRTPNIDRIADEGMRFTDSYGEQSCTAGRSSFITGQSVFRTGLSKVGVPGHGRRPAGRGSDDRRAAEAARLRHRAVRQEPPRRPEQVPADGARLRRVLRQPLPPERGGGAGAAELAAAPTTSRNFNERFGPRGVIHSWATDEDDDTEDARFGRVGKQRIEDTGPLTKKRMETIDDEVLEHGLDFIERQARRRHAVLRLAQHHAHALPHPPEAGERRPGRTLAVALPRHDDRPRQARRRAARQARRARDRRQHDRHLLDRQRPAHEHLAGRRHDPVPEREEHELGRRVPHPRADPLAREDPSRRRSRTRSSSTTTGCRRSSPPPASRTSSRS